MALLLACGHRSNRTPDRTLIPDSHHGGQQQSQDDSAKAGPLPNIYDLDGNIFINRAISMEQSIQSPGIEAYTNGQYGTNGGSDLNVEPSDPSLTLRTFSKGEYTYAVYGQAVGDSLRPLRTNIIAEACAYGGGRTDTMPLNYYVGIADYTMGAWRWFGPFNGIEAYINVNNEDLLSRFVSLANNYYLCILVAGGSKSASSLPKEGLVAGFPVDITAHGASESTEDPSGLTIRLVETWADEGFPTEPAYVTGLTATADTAGVALSWDANPDLSVTFYVVLRDDLDDADPAVQIHSNYSQYLSHIDDKGIPGKTYRYFVQALNNVGESGKAGVSSGRLLVTPSVTATDWLPDYIRVYWPQNEGATGFEIMRADTESGEPVSISQTASTVISYNDSEPALGERKWYSVRALGEDFNSDLSVPTDGVRAEGSARGDWWMYGRNGKHDRCSPFIGPQEPHLKWQYNNEPYGFSGPSIDAGGNIYMSGMLGSHDGGLTMFTPNGDPGWAFMAGDTGFPQSVPAIAEDGTAYVTDCYAGLSAVNPDGSPAWPASFDPSDDYADTSSPTLAADGTIYYSYNIHNDPIYGLYAFHPNGQQYWYYRIKGPMSTPAVGDDGTIYVSAADDYLWAINPNGSLKWQLLLARPFSEVSPAIGPDGTIYVPGGDGFLYAVRDEGTQGTLKWSYSTDVLECGPAIGLDGTIYIASSFHGVYALQDNGLSCSELWSYPLDSHALTGPTVDGEGTVYVGCSDYWLYAIDSFGELKWKFYAEVPVYGGPVISNDGTLYFTTCARLYALGESGNCPPVAEVTSDVNSGNIPLTVNFDASGSYDPDGSIVKYGWSFSGDWTDEYSSDSSPLASHTYNAAGNYRCRLRLTDNQGLTTQAVIEIQVADQGSCWQTVTVDYMSDVGLWTSLANVNGNPAIAYYDEFHGDLKYVRATDAAGSSWNPPITLDNLGNVGEYANLAVINGCPAIAYSDVTNNSLKYVRASDVNGFSWDVPVVVYEGSYSAGESISLNVVNDKPAIAFNIGRNLGYVQALDIDGSTWGTATTIDSDRLNWAGTALTVVDGFPAIAYNVYEPAVALKYVRAADADGATWNIPGVVSEGYPGNCPRLVIVDGNPAISYIDGNDGCKYIRSNDVEGNSWGSPVAVSFGWATHESMAVVNGIPMLAYRGIRDSLIFCESSDVDGSVWETQVIVDDPGNVGEYCSLADINGNPAISYYDSSRGDLKYAYWVP